MEKLLKAKFRACTVDGKSREDLLDSKLRR